MNCDIYRCFPRYPEWILREFLFKSLTPFFCVTDIFKTYFSSVKSNRHTAISEFALVCLYFISPQAHEHWQSSFDLYLKEDGSKRNSLQYVQTSAEIPAVNFYKNFPSSAKRSKISGKIAPRFGPPDICFSARFAIGSSETLAAGIFASRRGSWRDSRLDPGKILTAGNPESYRE